MVKFLSSLMPAPIADSPGSETFVLLFKIIVLKYARSLLRSATQQKNKTKCNHKMLPQMPQIVFKLVS